MNKINQMNKQKNRNSGETETIEVERNENVNKLYPQREIFIHERMVTFILKDLLRTGENS